MCAMANPSDILLNIFLLRWAGHNKQQDMECSNVSFGGMETKQVTNGASSHWPELTENLSGRSRNLL